MAMLLYTHYTNIIVLGLLGVCNCFLFARKTIKIDFLFSYIGADISFMPLLLYKIRAGNDVVTGCPSKGKINSKLFYHVFMMEINIPKIKSICLSNIKCKRAFLALWYHNCQ